MSSPENGILSAVYRLLEETYGFQGWWPLSGRAGRAGYDAEGYRTDASVAVRLNDEERLEIALGAVLTQNTAWENARRALASLRERGLLSHEGLRSVGREELASAIRSSGYFNQKAKKVTLVADFFARRVASGRPEAPERRELLALWGVGPETADSILLYAYSNPTFVADAYARRVLGRVGAVEETARYDRVREICHQALPRDASLYGEYHALLVRHARSYCLKAPRCGGCPLGASCAYGQGA